MTGETYSRRGNAFERADWTWAVAETGILERNPRNFENLIRWDDIDLVRLAYAPTRYKPWRYLLELRLKSGGKLTVDNVHFAGLANFEDRSASYRPFVEDVLAELKRRRPDVKVRVGSSPVAYWFLLAFVTAAFGLLALVLLALPGAGIPGVAWVKLAIVAVSLPVLVQWARKSYPRPGRLDAIPETVLPRIK